MMILPYTDLPMPMRSETAWIRLIERLAGPNKGPQLRVGIGDDAAVLTPPPAGFELLATTDQVVENKHFIVDQHPPDALGYKLLVRGLSDIAAMGGAPSWFLLSLAIPERLGDNWVERFLQGLLSARAQLGVPELPLVGGDVAGADILLAHITVMGAVPQGQALLRSGAQPGDLLYVSGQLGGSALGFERLGKQTDAAVARHLGPVPRLALGTFLRESGASAALDISDGLSTDIHRIAAASGVGMRLEHEKLPRFPGATDKHVLDGGEEYELLFTAPAAAAIPESFQDLRLTCIGCATGENDVLLERAGQAAPLPAAGYEHLTG